MGLLCSVDGKLSGLSAFLLDNAAKYLDALELLNSAYPSEEWE